MQSMSSGGGSGDRNSVENSVAKIRMTLVQLKLYKLGTTEIDARHATHEQFLAFAQTVVQIHATDGATLDKWTVEERRDFINWCISKGVLQVEGDRLVPVVPEGK